jgi:hypothetical protein
MSVAVHIEETSSPLTGGRLTCEELEALCSEAKPNVLVGERLLTAQAMRLLTRLDRDLREAWCQMNQDWFRRLMTVRRRAVSRLRRRWEKIYPAPALQLGGLRRRYHAHIARYFPEPQTANPAFLQWPFSSASILKFS